MMNYQALFLKMSTFIIPIFLGIAHLFSSNHEIPMEQLKNELSRYKNELVLVQSRIALLEKKIAEKQMTCIKKRIDKVQQNMAFSFVPLTPDQTALLFQDERGQLVKIREEVPSCAPQAQAILDQILSLITKLGDQCIE